MRLVLVDNLLLELSERTVATFPQPQLGLLSLAAVARASGHEALLYAPTLEVFEGRLAVDSSLSTRAADGILSLCPDVVGFTTLGCNFIFVLKVAKLIRERSPDITIMLGGPHATVLANSILQRYAQFDLVLKHEAEATLIPVLEGLGEPERLSLIPGVAHRTGHSIVEVPGRPEVRDLDDLPWPAYDLWPMDRLDADFVRVEAGRGCPFACTFCSTATFFGRHYRVKSARRLRSDLDRLQREYGFRRFSLQHDLFTVNRRKVVEFCDAMAGSDVEWTCSARMDCVDEDLLQRMSEAGCRSIYFGVETGSPRLQSVVKKKLDLGLFDPTLDACAAAGIKPTVSFIVGFPEETENDQDATLDLLGSTFGRAGPLDRQLHLLTPEPGTGLSQNHETLEFDGYLSDFNLPLLEEGDADLTLADPIVFSAQHYYPSVAGRERSVFCVELFSAMDLLGADLGWRILEEWEGRLSALTHALFNRWSDDGRPALGFEYLVSALGDLHSRDSAIPALCEYYALLVQLSRQSASGTPDRKPCLSEGSIMLAPNVAVLLDTVNGPEVLAALAQRRTVPAKKTQLLVAVTSPGGPVRNLELSEGAALVLQSLEKPRSLDDVVECAKSVGWDPDDLRKTLGFLVSEQFVSAG